MTPSAKAKESYLELVRRFPLRAIRTQSAAVAANHVLLELVMSKPKMSTGEKQYIEALTALVRQYESGRRESAMFHCSPLEVLKHLMEETGMRTNDLGRVIGHQPTASQILNGKRELSKVHIQKLAVHFRVSPALFMDQSGRDYRRAS
jgi:HTH-type transcriptional regulator / antitoxin HigA